MFHFRPINLIDKDRAKNKAESKSRKSLASFYWKRTLELVTI
jgi:hypothetical protein